MPPPASPPSAPAPSSTLSSATVAAAVHDASTTAAASASATAAATAAAAAAAAPAAAPAPPPATLATATAAPSLAGQAAAWASLTSGTAAVTALAVALPVFLLAMVRDALDKERAGDAHAAANLDDGAATMAATVPTIMNENEIENENAEVGSQARAPSVEGCDVADAAADSTAPPPTRPPTPPAAAATTHVLPGHWPASPVLPASPLVTASSPPLPAARPPGGSIVKAAVAAWTAVAAAAAGFSTTSSSVPPSPSSSSVLVAPSPPPPPREVPSAPGLQEGDAEHGSASLGTRRRTSLVVAAPSAAAIASAAAAAASTSSTPTSPVLRVSSASPTPSHSPSGSASPVPSRLVFPPPDVRRRSAAINSPIPSRPPSMALDAPPTVGRVAGIVKLFEAASPALAPAPPPPQPPPPPPPPKARASPVAVTAAMARKRMSALELPPADAPAPVPTARVLLGSKPLPALPVQDEDVAHRARSPPPQLPPRPSRSPAPPAPATTRERDTSPPPPAQDAASVQAQVGEDNVHAGGGEAAAGDSGEVPAATGRREHDLTTNDNVDGDARAAAAAPEPEVGSAGRAAADAADAVAVVSPSPSPPVELAPTVEGPSDANVDSVTAVPETVPPADAKAHVDPVPVTPVDNVDSTHMDEDVVVEPVPAEQAQAHVPTPTAVSLAAKSDQDQHVKAAQDLEDEEPEVVAAESEPHDAVGEPLDWIVEDAFVLVDRLDAGVSETAKPTVLEAVEAGEIVAEEADVSEPVANEEEATAPVVEQQIAEPAPVAALAQPTAPAAPPAPVPDRRPLTAPAPLVIPRLALRREERVLPPSPARMFEEVCLYDVPHSVAALNSADGDDDDSRAARSAEPVSDLPSEVLSVLDLPGPLNGLFAWAEDTEPDLRLRHPGLTTIESIDEDALSSSFEMGMGGEEDACTVGEEYAPTVDDEQAGVGSDGEEDEEARLIKQDDDDKSASASATIVAVTAASPSSTRTRLLSQPTVSRITAYRQPSLDLSSSMAPLALNDLPLFSPSICDDTTTPPADDTENDADRILHHRPSARLVGSVATASRSETDSSAMSEPARPSSRLHRHAANQPLRRRKKGVPTHDLDGARRLKRNSRWNHALDIADLDDDLAEAAAIAAVAVNSSLDATLSRSAKKHLPAGVVADEDADEYDGAAADADDDDTDDDKPLIHLSLGPSARSTRRRHVGTTSPSQLHDPLSVLRRQTPRTIPPPRLSSATPAAASLITSELAQARRTASLPSPEPPTRPVPPIPVTLAADEKKPVPRPPSTASIASGAPRARPLSDGADPSAVHAHIPVECVGTSLKIEGQALRRLSDTALSTFAHVTELSLNSNRLEALPSSLARLVHLEVLRVSENCLAQLPLELQALTKLKTLDVSVNQLLAIPPWIKELQELVTLDVRTNQLTTLPVELGTLPKLKTLLVDSNPWDATIKPLVEPLMQPWCRSSACHVRLTGNNAIPAVAISDPDQAAALDMLGGVTRDFIAHAHHDEDVAADRRSLSSMESVGPVMQISSSAPPAAAMARGRTATTHVPRGAHGIPPHQRFSVLSDDSGVILSHTASSSSSASNQPISLIDMPAVVRPSVTEPPSPVLRVATRFGSSAMGPQSAPVDMVETAAWRGPNAEKDLPSLPVIPALPSLADAMSPPPAKRRSLDLNAVAVPADTNPRRFSSSGDAMSPQQPPLLAFPTRTASARRSYEPSTGPSASPTSMRTVPLASPTSAVARAIAPRSASVGPSPHRVAAATATQVAGSPSRVTIGGLKTLLKGRRSSHRGVAPRGLAAASSGDEASMSALPRTSDESQAAIWAGAVTIGAPRNSGSSGSGGGNPDRVPHLHIVVDSPVYAAAVDRALQYLRDVYDLAPTTSERADLMARVRAEIAGTDDSASPAPSPAISHGELAPKKPADPVKRKNIIAEILATEDTYIAELAYLVKHYVQPMEDRQILSPEEVKGLFSNVESILKFHSDFLIGAMRANQDRLGRVFAQHSAYLKMYSVFINAYDQAMVDLSKWLPKRKKVRQFCETVVQDPAHHQINLQAYLMLPIQRIPRYRLLLQSLLKQTPEDHADFTDLTRALAEIEAIAKKINERKRLQKDTAKLICWVEAAELPLVARSPSGRAASIMSPKLTSVAALSGGTGSSGTASPAGSAAAQIVVDGPAPWIPDATTPGGDPDPASPRARYALTETPVPGRAYQVFLFNDWLLVCKRESAPAAAVVAATTGGAATSDPLVAWRTLTLKSRVAPASITRSGQLRVVDATGVVYFAGENASELARWEREINARYLH
ncbi:hypothetical protein AMAG_00682 [Allomyces macrogynus ATCC 38327]|uniref:DH domain-containing protein n=1 Tax=Allomyces macrogynus (strain ATCC 38327) TaxID=578462 RepID=A0A0L0RWJ3_ALLM3|nr:hypothetical protein AMAG_00682 [Allomyces macrogynus ATCC 38327]|eukprot:KNE54723.1 hypothetical protein AMAG_00682 [Allomyces macrogynus ATCC 38327]